MIPTCSIIFSETDLPSSDNSFNADKSAGFSFMAIFSIFSANPINSWFFATKSVSQFKTIIVPSVSLSATFAKTTPSLASRSARLLATACPFLRIISIALLKSPPDSSRAFLQSIIPAPVVFLNLVISLTLICAIPCV